MAKSKHRENKIADFSHIRRVKRLLRYMPRRANLDRYPFLKYFASWARKRDHLWSFRSKQVVPALYAGFILALMPLYGVQIPIAFALALTFRANLMILVGLQFITNPLTIWTIYPVCYVIGDWALDIVGMQSTELAEVYVVETGTRFGSIARKVGMAFIETTVGGAIIGYLCALASSITYRMFARRMQKKSPYLRGKEARKKENRTDDEEPLAS